MKSLGRGACRILVSSLLIFSLGRCAVAAQSEHGFIDRVYRDDAGEHKYVVFVPQGYTPDKAWPTILFLHGAGERGTDGQAQVKVGLGPAIRKQEQTFPFIAVFPQCEDRDAPAKRGWIAESADGKRALAILAEVEKSYRTEKDRVILVGLSMGGFGVWSHGAANPARWAALVPICGGGDPKTASKLAAIPIWCFHGADDRLVPVDESRRMIAAVKAAGGQPHYTELPGVGHDAWEPAFATEELYSWMQAQKRSAAGTARGTPTAIRIKPRTGQPAPAAAPPEEPFIPALEIPHALYVRLGNEMLSSLADSLPSVIPADALNGTLQDINTTTSAEGRTIQVRFAGLSYRGHVSRVTMEAQAEDRVAAVISLRDVNLVIDRTFLSSDQFSATCGPIRIVLGHRADLPLSFQVKPTVDQGKLRFKLLGTQFRLTPDNWTVSSPAWVNTSSSFVPEGRVASGVRDGIYRDSSRIEREVAGALPRMLTRLEDQFSLESTHEIVSSLWPLPVYKPRFRLWPTFVETDAKGITVALGVAVAAFDRQSAPAQPTRVQLPGDGTVRTIHSEQFQFGLAPGLMETVSTQVVADDAARAQVPDMPMQKLQPLGDAMALAELVPDLKQRGDKEVRAELRLTSPIRLNRGEGDAADDIIFELPKVRCAIAVHPDPSSTLWQPYLDIDFNLRQPARPAVSSPTQLTRALQLNWQGDAAISVDAQFAADYTPSDRKIDTDRIREILAEAWKEWTSSGPLAQAALDDVDLGFSKLRAEQVGWSGTYLAATFGPAGLIIRNVTSEPLTYEMKGPYSPWGGPYTLEPDQKHKFPIAYPVTCRFKAGTGRKEYTLPPGSAFEFQVDSKGIPDIFTTRESAPGAVSMRNGIADFHFVAILQPLSPTPAWGMLNLR